MIRLPEPEVMDDIRQVIAYSKADFNDSNQLFIYSLLAAFTIEEIEKQLKATPFSYQIDKTGTRHFIVECTFIPERSYL